MTLDAMTRYIQPESLVIIGNREDAQLLALNQGAAVLITGGIPSNATINSKSRMNLKFQLMGTNVRYIYCCQPHQPCNDRSID